MKKRVVFFIAVAAAITVCLIIILVVKGTDKGDITKVSIKTNLDIKSTKTVDGGGDAISTDVDIDIQGGLGTAQKVDPVDFDDPFKNPVNNDPNKYFSSTQFDNWIPTASFSLSDIPYYSFGSGDWQMYSEISNASQANGDNTTGGGHRITDVVYYVYESKNPLFPVEGDYNTGAHGEKIARFNFYRITGMGGGIEPLNEMIFAVDKNTKLVFLYAVPIKFKHIFGKSIPTQWGSVDTVVQDGAHRFYEYDPIGIVGKGGIVKLYDWYKSYASQSNYYPIINLPIGDIASYASSGRSPYYNLHASVSNAGLITNQ